MYWYDEARTHWANFRSNDTDIHKVLPRKQEKVWGILPKNQRQS